MAQRGQCAAMEKYTPQASTTLHVPPVCARTDVFSITPKEINMFRRAEWFLAATIATAVASGARGQILFVDNNSPASCAAQDGLSWQTAFRFLQDAIDKLVDEFPTFSTIQVAQGRYFPDERCELGAPVNTNDQFDSFILPVGIPITIEGGYRGCPTGNCSDNPPGTDPSDQNIDEFVTVLSGDIRQDDTISPLGITASWQDINPATANSVHVMRFDTTPEGDQGEGIVVVAGLTITAGDADEGTPETLEDSMGGGVLLNATLGGDSLPGPRFEDCDFIGNRADGAGGAIGGLKIGATLKRCFFSKNQASSLPLDPAENDGGGAVSLTGSMVLADCIFKQNESFGPGGAVDGPGQLENVLYNCAFVKNTADTQGGGAFIFNAELVNCLFDSNLARGLAEAGGGGLAGAAHVTNCTFFGNEAQGPPGITGGGALIDNIGSSVWNSIFWANTSRGGVNHEPQLDSDGLICPFFCDIQGFVPPECGYLDDPPGGNIDVDPEFSLTTGDDPKFFLRPTSPCIDTGNDDQEPSAPNSCRAPFTPAGLVLCDAQNVDEDMSLMEPTPDLNTNERVLEVAGPNQVDMGAYEYFDCLGDITGTPESSGPDGWVSIVDLLKLLADWGQCPSPPEPCPADICGSGGPDGTVAINDLLCLIANWGCPAQNDPMPASVQGCMDRYMPDVQRTAACITALGLSGGG